MKGSAHGAMAGSVLCSARAICAANVLFSYETASVRRLRPMTTRTTAKATALPSWEHVNSRLAVGALAQYRAQASADQLVIYANNSMDFMLLRRLFRAFALFCALICALSVLQGNIWAPIFLLLNGVMVAFAMRAVMRRCQAADSVTVRGRDLIARQNRLGRQHEVVFPLAWVRLMVEHPRAESRVHLRVHSESMEIGSFLNREQRERMAEQLKTFLDLAKARAVSTL